MSSVPLAYGTNEVFGTASPSTRQAMRVMMATPEKLPKARGYTSPSFTLSGPPYHHISPLPSPRTPSRNPQGRSMALPSPPRSPTPAVQKRSQSSLGFRNLMERFQAAPATPSKPLLSSLRRTNTTGKPVAANPAGNSTWSRKTASILRKSTAKLPAENLMLASPTPTRNVAPKRPMIQSMFVGMVNVDPEYRTIEQGWKEEAKFLKEGYSACLSHCEIISIKDPLESPCGRLMDLSPRPIDEGPKRVSAQKARPPIPFGKLPKATVEAKTPVPIRRPIRQTPPTCLMSHRPMVSNQSPTIPAGIKLPVSVPRLTVAPVKNSQVPPSRPGTLTGEMPLDPTRRLAPAITTGRTHDPRSSAYSRAQSASMQSAEAHSKTSAPSSIPRPTRMTSARPVVSALPASSVRIIDRPRPPKPRKSPTALHYAQVEALVEQMTGSSLSRSSSVPVRSPPLRRASISHDFRDLRPSTPLRWEKKTRPTSPLLTPTSRQLQLARPPLPDKMFAAATKGVPQIRTNSPAPVAEPIAKRIEKLERMERTLPPREGC